MKTILFYAALSVAATASLQAQNAPNREGAGQAPGAAPGRTEGSAPKSADQGSRTSDAKESAKNADERFIHKAAKAGRMEMKLAEQGASKATREDLKAFSAMLIKDHTAANQELAAIAKSMGVETPGAAGDKEHGKEQKTSGQNDPSGRKTAADSADGQKHESEAAKFQSLSQKTGAAFDAAFIEVMEDCHTKDIALFGKAEAEVESPVLKAYITKTLPVLRQHAAALAALDQKNPGQPGTADGARGTKAPSAPGQATEPNRQ